ncbi:type II toxin-antitoxin system RatA family toxin [Rhodoferax sp.]|uniref:type II toxin-antitoxin system RatA family toxin n=1 Tax=Rhodoferax sp. TaxID=50421 RepID=UPI001EC460A2|nr:type II toxin-antitoxin system RatA family toxin [Rhodoferax sp.]MBT9506803.1 type II toxin-antitoxin system RatA family toxin [Rhodoferax sp.]
MKTVKKSVLIWYSPQEMYVLVTEVDQYPKFLPWCDHARVVSSDETGMTAEVGISFSGIRQTFTTRNEHTQGRQVAMTLVNGPFSKLDGEWNFLPLGDGSQRACKVELSLSYGFENATLGKLVGPVFDKIAASLVDAFVKRAAQVYGE